MLQGVYTRVLGYCQATSSGHTHDDLGQYASCERISRKERIVGEIMEPMLGGLWLFAVAEPSEIPSFW